MGVVNDDIAKAADRQAFQMPDDERLATGAEQRLGRCIGERPHALAAAGGENEGFH
jgi:hypothetical protein